MQSPKHLPDTVRFSRCTGSLQSVSHGHANILSVYRTKVKYYVIYDVLPPSSESAFPAMCMLPADIPLCLRFFIALLR